MEDNRVEENQVYVSGEIISGFRSGFRRCCTDYYVAEIAVRRLSSRIDCIPVLFRDGMVDAACDYVGRYVSVTGQYVSYNLYEDGKRRLKLYVMAGKWELLDAGGRNADENYIFLDGHICREPIYRKTPLGRSITDLLVVVGSPGKMSCYIPCICWGKTAYAAASLPVGARVGITGRIQSREYCKRLDPFTSEKRIAMKCLL